jgi:hypothetical protein
MGRVNGRNDTHAGHRQTECAACLTGDRASDFAAQSASASGNDPTVKTLFLCSRAVASAWADAPSITWPSGWQIEACPTPPQVSRQRAVKNDADGNQVMVMELTMTQVEAGHQVNLQGVLLEMRKSIQKDFFQGGYQSVCIRMHRDNLERTALETTCTIRKRPTCVVANIGCGGRCR